MHTNPASESGTLNPRLFFSFLLCSAAAFLALFSFAAPSPTSDTLSRTHSVTYTDSLGAPLNPSHLALGKPNCGPSDAACSVFTLTLDPSVKTIASGYDPANFQLLFQWSWAVNTVDFDVFLEDSAGNLLKKNTSTSDPSSIIIAVNDAPTVMKLVVVLSTGAPIAYTGTVTLQPAPPPGGCSPQANCAPPRYQNFPAGPGQADGAGEPSLGVDWNPNVAALKHDKVNTGGVAFFTANRTEWRANFDDCASPAINLWEDVSAITTQEFVLTDPIGFVDHYSTAALGLAYPPPTTPGRVFSLDLIGGEGQSLASYSDTDGNSYLPGGNGGPGAGPDHETLGGGPYSATQTVPISHPSYPNAIYYCSQNIVTEAQCSRSDDGGQTFGPAVPIFTPNQCTGGIHGHVKVARDGTVYVPNSSCGTTGTAGVAISTDNGLTWHENNVNASTSSQDPSVGIGQNDVGKPAGQTTNTIYLGYVDGDNHAKIVVSGDRGVTYSTPVDVGAAFGVTNAVFPVVVAGDDQRAAFAFLGTGNGISTNTSPCNPYGATLNCKNIWHLYVATTYDRGANWITVDATPEDPAQQGTVCLEGTTCLGGRNLLDFNDFAIDSQGRGLVGWADGCVNCTNAFVTQSGAAHGTITRQSGGRRLFAFFDPVEPAAPAAPQLLSAVVQPTGGALVTWREPDNGGSPITGYNIYRGTSSGTETLFAAVSGNTTTKYLDPLTPPFPTGTNVFYYVTAVNGFGESTHCREVSLNATQPDESACTLPYVTIAGAGSPGTVPTDPTSGELTIERVGVGEPFVNCNEKTITFLMKVQTLQPAPPPNAEWQVIFQVPDTTGTMRTIFVEAETQANPAVVSYGYGYRTTSPTGGSQDTGQGPAKVTGTTNPDGTITMKLDVSAPLVFNDLPGVHQFDVDISIGTKLQNIGGNTYLLVGAKPGGTGGGLIENISKTSATGSYTRKGNVACLGLLPIAALAATPTSGPPPLAVNFDGKGSSEPAGACGVINSYTLNFGDGTAPETNATGTFSHTYADEGEFPAQLTVKDSAGLVSTNVAQVIIAVGNRPPVADLKANPTSGTAPLSVHFDASGSTDPDFNDVPVNYRFRFGDGTPDASQGSPAVDHTYASPGTYAARLVVTDSRGKDSENIAEQIITVQSNVSPTPTATASPTPTATATASPTPTATATASPTPTATATASATASPSATATATASPSATATATPTPTGTPTATPVNVSLLNISGRVFAKTGDKVGIGGFIISGAGTKRIMARAIGPSLSIDGKLQDPYLELHDSNGSPPLVNDNWRSTQEAEIQSTGLAPINDREAAIVKRLPAGSYTAIIRGADNSPGIGVVELYDLSGSEPGELGNLSVRADVGTGDNVLFNGLILRGGTSKRVLFRALGPSVKVNGSQVPGALQDPILELHDGNGALMATNDNWPDASNAAEIQATGLAPPDNHESAILVTLSAGNYTTIVRGVGNSIGIALAEAYKLDN
jgi:PKD repeat protein